MSVNVTNTAESMRNQTFSDNSTDASSASPTEEGYSEEDLMKLAIFTAVQPLVDSTSYIMWIIGIPSNILSLLTSSRMRPFSSSTWFISVLAMVDLLYVLWDGLVFYLVFPVFKAQVSNEVCRLYFYVGTILIHYAIWLMVAITVERFVAVWMPLKVSTICTTRRAIVFTALCPLCLLVVNIPITYTPSSFAAPGGMWYCDYDPDFYDLMSKWTFVDNLINGFIPLPVLVFCNVMIVLGLRKSAKRKQQLTNKTDVDAKDPNLGITIMLVTASVVAVILLTPNLIFFVYTRSTQWNYRATAEEYATFQFLNAFVFFLSSLNHCLNFWLYVVSGRRFRQAFLALLCCKRQKAKYKQPSTAITKVSMPKQSDAMNDKPSTEATAPSSELVN